MKRIKLVLALAAAMVSSLAAVSPAYAVGNPNDMPGEGLTTATEAGVGNPNERAFVATREAPPAIGNPDVMPGYGVDTAQSAQR
jgi:hypothetical protein